MRPAAGRRWLPPACLAGILLAGCGPWGPLGAIPGGPLAGDLVEEPVPDWSFTNQHLTIAIETRGPLLDHSVTVLCMAHDGHLYIPSRHAPNKRWVKNVLADPRVRLGIGDRIYEGRAERVTDPVEAEAVSRKFLRKYVGIEAEHVRALSGEPGPGDDRALLWTFRVDSVGSGS